MQQHATARFARYDVGHSRQRRAIRPQARGPVLANAQMTDQLSAILLPSDNFPSGDDRRGPGYKWADRERCQPEDVVCQLVWTSRWGEGHPVRSPGWSRLLLQSRPNCRTHASGRRAKGPTVGGNRYRNVEPPRW